MESDTKLFLQNKFREYYKNARVDLPPKFSKREWAIVLFDDAYPRFIMRRHKAFSTFADIATYLETLTPAHVYHSTAYYKYPSASKMISKEWQAADLIFDLDADQIIKGDVSSYSHMLNAVKDETKKLLMFLTEDFALNEDNIRVVFSGGRGYHVHVREERLTKLGSHERREVINYVSGSGLEAEYIIYPKKISEYSESPTRWETRIIKWIEHYFKSLLEMQESDAIGQLTSFKDIGSKKAKEIFENLEEIIENLDGSSEAPRLIKSRLTTDSFWKGVVRRAILESKVNVDEPVTADTKRLIRLPSSLHGGSGFCVAPINWEQFDDFDPLYDAVVFSDEMTPVRVLSKTTTEIKNETILADEKTVELPEHTAIYLMARGFAEYEPQRSKSHKK